MARRDRRKPASVPVAQSLTGWLWFHPQRGAVISLDAIVVPRLWSYLGGNDGDWRELGTVRLESKRPIRVAPGQRLPAGFLWADPAQQEYGLGGPFHLYGPQQRTCVDCGETFTWSARAQKQLFEVGKANTSVIAKRCQRCARALRNLEAKRQEYATALRAAEETPSAAAHIRVAKTVIELVRAGGKASLDRALGHCRRARKLGGAASVVSVEAALRALRAG